MDNLPRKKLAELVGRFGRDIATDARRCEAILRDLCPECKREIFILVSAAKESVPAELLGSSSGLPKEVLLSRLSKRLHENLGVAENLARWAVESWSLALGVADSKDFRFPFKCPGCAAVGSVASRLAGQTIRCPKCKQAIRISSDGRTASISKSDTQAAESVTMQSSVETARAPASPVTPAAGVPQEDDLFSDFPRVSAEEILRQTVRRVLADGIVSEEERAEVHKLRTDLGISRDVAARIVSEIQTEMGLAQQGTKVSSVSTAPVAPQPAPVSLAQAVQSVIAEVSRRIQDHTNCYFWPNIPADKMRNAVSKYAPLSAGETVLFLYDNTVWGGAKDGAVVTDHAVYAHDMGSSPKSVRIADISSVSAQNGVFSGKVFVNGGDFLTLNLDNRQLVISILSELRDLAGRLAR